MSTDRNMPGKPSKNNPAGAGSSSAASSASRDAMPTYDAMKSLADAALKTAFNGWQIAMRDLSNDSEFKRGLDILNLGVATLEKMNEVVKRAATNLKIYEQET